MIEDNAHESDAGLATRLAADAGHLLVKVRDELTSAGAFRVYRDAAELRRNLHRDRHWAGLCRG